MTDPKPPVPSDEELLEKARHMPEFNPSGDDLTIPQCCWLAGYHARDAREERLEGDNRFVQSELMKRIAEFEAEVAELRKRERELEAELDECESEAGEAIDSAPRRTPELTERVAAAMRRADMQPHEARWYWAILTKAAMDEVFGKDPTDG